MRRIGVLIPLAADDPQSQRRMTAFVQGLELPADGKFTHSEDVSSPWCWLGVITNTTPTVRSPPITEPASAAPRSCVFGASHESAVSVRKIDFCGRNWSRPSDQVGELTGYA